jgi:hypothetical protein
MKRKMTKQEAIQTLHNAGVPLSLDYHMLRTSDVDKILACAKLYGYRKSKNAPGSTGWMFFQFLHKGR